jgi:hypothetical protein
MKKYRETVFYNIEREKPEANKNVLPFHFYFFGLFSDKNFVRFHFEDEAAKTGNVRGQRKMDKENNLINFAPKK